MIFDKTVDGSYSLGWDFLIFLQLLTVQQGYNDSLPHYYKMKNKFSLSFRSMKYRYRKTY